MPDLAPIAVVVVTAGVLAKPALWLTQRIVLMFTLLLHFKEAWPVLEEIAEEFKPNGGASLRDRVNVIETDINRVEKTVTVVDGKLDVVIDLLKRD